MNETTTFEDFTAAAHAAGFDEVLERRWAPNTELDDHAHSFDAKAIVKNGEMWLTCDGVTRHLIGGDTFTVARQVQHSERYGSQGATLWVARRNAQRNGVQSVA